MNILLLNWRDPKNPRAGGAEYVTREHAKAWVKKGNTVTWFTAHFPGAKREEIIDGVRVVRQGNVLSVFIRAALYYLRHKKHIDVIVDEVHGIPYFSALYAKKPVILFIHEVAGVIWGRMYPLPIALLGKTLEKFFLFVYRHHKIWTDASSTVDELVRLGVPRKNCVAIACPSGVPSLNRRPEKRSVPTFIFVGRLVRMKRVEDILKAFRIIRKTLPNAQLQIVGEGYHKPSRSVTWFGRVSEKKKIELLRKAHILLHASVKEGWGLVVLEAASQWTPSVVYGVSGLVDVVHNGKTGIITKADPLHLARQAVSLYNDPKKYERMQKTAAAFNSTLRWVDATKKSLDLISEFEES